uniref:uncharacterized protein LOC113475731 n=1 Tax=Ciona intestinalis TaxID=7719 RepID=UPI000EF53D11|nr:uncharacterized protein LOC113475731 [Ciona intestinalis]|eukprot:XP_026696188.1 uncharacterized protein LOC113475731 [Ciona intestinalis]
MSLAQCRCAVSTRWGLNPKSMMWLYCQVVRPMLSYACMVTTPTRALEALLNLPPLHLHLQGNAVYRSHRLKTLGQWEGGDYYTSRNKRHTYICNRISKEIQTLSLPCDRCIPSLHFDHSLRLVIEDRSSFKPPDPPHQSDGIICYTDGSKTVDRTGSGYLITRCTETKQVSVSLGSYASVFQTEILAINMVAKELLYDGTDSKSVDIYSDSQARINSLLVRDTWYYALQQLASGNHVRLHWIPGHSDGNHVRLHWIPGHSDHLGNELADKLARDGSSKIL